MNKQLHTEYLSCPIRHVIDRFGDKWSLLVLYALWRNEGGVMRFGELHRFMDDCSQKMLSQTLKSLVSNHLVSRKQYPEIPPRVEYAPGSVSHATCRGFDRLESRALRRRHRRQGHRQVTECSGVKNVSGILGILFYHELENSFYHEFLCVMGTIVLCGCMFSAFF